MNSKLTDLLIFLYKYSIIFALLIIFIPFSIMFIKFIGSKTLHKNHKFVIFLTLISSFGAVALVATLLLNIYYRREDIDEISFQNYNTIWEKQNDLIDEFMSHPEMEYFYLDLYGQSKSNKGRHFTRNIVYERNLFNMLMNDISTIVAYLDAKKYSSSKNNDRIRARFDKLLNLHIKSKYFLEYWKTYKITVAPTILIKYMKDNYNI